MNLSTNNHGAERHLGHESRVRRLSPEGVEAVRSRAEVRANALYNLQRAAFGRFPELQPQPQLQPVMRQPEVALPSQPAPVPGTTEAMTYPMELTTPPATNDAVAEAERIVAEAYNAMHGDSRA